MKKIAFVFPGYGCSHAGMGKGICEYSEKTAEIYEKASGVLGVDAALLSSKGKSAEVAAEEISFQLQLLQQLSLFEAAKDILPAPEALIGYSAGEITAMTAGNVFTVEDGVSVANAYRDMRKAAAGAGKLDSYRLRNVKHEFVSLVSDKCFAGFVQMTAVEAPEQTVVIGDEDGLKSVLTELAKHKVVPSKLRDSLPLHSVMVFPYVAKLQDAMRDIAHSDLSVPMYSTLYGKRIDVMTLPSDYFAKQQVNAVRFHEAVSAAVKDEFDTFVILGKDKDLFTAVKNIAGESNVFIADSVDDLKKIADKIKE
ncbi:MAG: acyltransferase domain-containing protein [Oscillospiraceae bacterium]|nr:acyltransferase domain-containing protein [Oscillospiraceae bacterium]